MLHWLKSRWAQMACAALVLAALELTGVVRSIDSALEQTRFALTQRAPSQKLIVVEIDNASLRAAGRWPWARRRYAEVIANLRRAGASVIGFDVDFSAKSTPSDDKAMRDAIEGGAGDVALPVFLQRYSSARNELLESRPLDAFSRRALLAYVNVELNADGKVRSYDRGHQIGGEFRPSMAAILAGARQSNQKFSIDYGIQPERIARLSFEDVYRDAFDPNLVRGKAVLIGATALELGDNFSTPMSPSIPGVYIHALAFESLIANRGLWTVSGVPSFLLGFFTILILWPRQGQLNIARLLVRHGAVASGAILGPLALQMAAPVNISTGFVLIAQAFCILRAVRVELVRRAQEIIKQREENLLRLSTHDVETELPNRRALLTEIEAKIQAAELHAPVVIVIGLDRYSMLRGAVGYAACNELMRNFAARVSAYHEGVLVAHLSTSILGLVMTAPDAASAFRDCRQRILDMDTRVEVGGQKLDALYRAGIAFGGKDYASAETLLEHATIALDQARALNRRFVMFEPDHFINPIANLSMVGDMMQGIKRGEFDLFYQPKLSIDRGAIAGAEGLMRWRRPGYGSVSPDEFIAAAEETGTIRALTEWALHRAIFDQLELRAKGHDVVLSINISARMLCDEAFCRVAIEAVRDSAAKLCFEITETAVIEDPLAAMAAIASFRDIGIKISIDDYGAGFSSLSYLKQIAAHELKIDKSLISDLGGSERDQMILRSTIDLAHSLGLSVVAEGVEDFHILQILGSMRCDMVQGYVVSPALPLQAFCDLLSAFNKPKDALADSKARAI